MKFFSINSICFYLALLLALLPAWACIQDKRLPTLIEYISILTSVVLAAFTLYSTIKNSYKLSLLNDRISSFSVETVLDYSWPKGSNPLLDNENDSSQSTEELFWLTTSNGIIKLYTFTGYTVIRTGPNSAQFKAHLSPKNGEIPLGQQIDLILKAKDYTTFVILKNYWINGRDNYAITVNKHENIFYINDRVGRFKTEIPKTLQPIQAGQTIWGLIDAHVHLEAGIGSIFDFN